MPVYIHQYISGDTVAKVNLLANRGGNIKDKHGRVRVSVFQEAAEEINYIHQKAENEVGHELPHPDLYERALQRARTENAVAKRSANNEYNATNAKARTG